MEGDQIKPLKDPIDSAVIILTVGLLAQGFATAQGTVTFLSNLGTNLYREQSRGK